MLKSRLDQILTWFRHRVTNSTAEGFISRIRSLQSNVRGYRSYQRRQNKALLSKSAILFRIYSPGFPAPRTSD